MAQCRRTHCPKQPLSPGELASVAWRSSDLSWKLASLALPLTPLGPVAAREGGASSQSSELAGLPQSLEGQLGLVPWWSKEGPGGKHLRPPPPRFLGLPWAGSGGCRLGQGWLVSVRGLAQVGRSKAPCLTSLSLLGPRRGFTADLTACGFSTCKRPATGLFLLFC